MSVIVTTRNAYIPYYVLDTGKVDDNGQHITVKCNPYEGWDYAPRAGVGENSSLINALQPLLEYTIIRIEQECESILSE